MPRIFIAIDLPDVIKDGLGDLAYGIPGTRWVDSEKLHLTLRFIGNVDGGLFREIRAYLADLRFPPFEVSLQEVGFFGRKGKPHTLWVGLKKSPDLVKLKHQIDTLLEEVDIANERRKFAPHITIARCNHDVDPKRVADFLSTCYGFATDPFTVDAVYLMSSTLTQKGAAYDVEQAYPLANSERERLQWLYHNGFPDGEL